MFAPIFWPLFYCAAYNGICTSVTHLQSRASGSRKLPTKPLESGLRMKATNILVPVHNAVSHAIECVKSIQHTTHRFPEVTLHVVDDGSSSDTTELQELVERVGSFERRKQSIGYTRNANEFLESAPGEQFFIINSDAIVFPGWLERMTKQLWSTPTTGLVSPLSNAAGYQSIPRNRTNLFEKAFRQTPINALPNGLTGEAVNTMLAESSHRQRIRVPFVHGFLIGIKAEVVRSIGVFDGKTFPFGYGEEIDYSFRAEDAGWSSALAHDVYAWHVKSASFGRARKMLLTSAGKNGLIRKHGRKRLTAASKAMGGLHSQLKQTLGPELSAMIRLTGHQ